MFKAIETQVVPALIKPGKTLRIWSAACSFGQEVYSLMMMLEEMKRNGAQINYRIDASDVAERALDRSRKARYSQLEIQRGLPTPLLIRYFSKDAEDYWSVRPEFLRNVDFRKQNLRDASLGTTQTYDLILCRNVLIYQKVEDKAAVIGKLLRHLEPDGHLVLGAGESLLGVSNDFDQVLCEGAILYRPKRKAS